MIKFVIGNYSVWFGKFFSCCRYKHYSEEMSSSINILFLKGDEKRKYDQISRIEHCDMRDIYISNSKIIGSIIMKKDVILKCREELMDLLSKCLGFFSASANLDLVFIFYFTKMINHQFHRALHTFTTTSWPAFPRANHSIDNFSQTVIVLIDCFPKSPTSRNFATHHVECEHFAFAFNIDDSTFSDDVASLGQNL